MKRRAIEVYTISVVISLVMCLLSGMVLRLYPFGDNTLLFDDGAQYLGVYKYFSNALLGRESFLYSWGNALGGNGLAAIAYYASSPFNLLLALFDSNILLGFHIIAVVKVICSSLSFCYFLSKLPCPACLAPP